ncbi:MAG: GNAT family N-acetyltransferase [Verrucomicrobiales bacterium]
MDLSFVPVTMGDVAGIDEWLADGDLLEFMSGWRPRSVRRGEWRVELCRWDFIVADNLRVGTVWLERGAVGDQSADLGILIANPDDRGKGIGSATIRQVESVAIGCWGTKLVRLRVRASNAMAIACYRQIGFVPIRMENKTVGAIDVEVLHMEHHLDPSGTVRGD